jgi:hypothetical protein
MLGWVDTIVQGILLGGLYSLYATGLSVIFGIMRLVNLAHGDLIVLGAFLILALTAAGVPLLLAFAIVLPVMFAVGYFLQAAILNRVIGRNILPPLLITFGLSIIVQNGLLEAFSADTRFLNVGPLQSASLPLGGGIAIGVMPLICLAAAVAVIVLLNGLFYRLSRHLGRRRDRAAHGHQQQDDLRADHGGRRRRLRRRRVFPRRAGEFRSEHRPGAAALRLRGGDYRRAGQSVGHARRGDCRRPRPNHRRAYRSGMANSLRPRRVPDCAGAAAARAVPARNGLKAAP